jgi:signal transduction histidine kinase
MQINQDLEINLQLDSDRQTLPEPVRMALFRIYQTAITNVIRHAQANQAFVRLHLNQKQVRLEIQDNGCGFKVPNSWIELARQKHLGLVGAAERAEAAGGKLQVESAPSRGTLVRVIVPRNHSAK